ncbi:hypothetical protein B296_00006330 [Ensete ventricosum]|uniref:Uncharacterized protein n=1 Tax=Ensete ventricosum TaxID=4639 RepID=A0A427ACU1_ENSVE|nr:hypothetical protein B296_00006330 [Ensete ventricosum]
MVTNRAWSTKRHDELSHFLGEMECQPALGGGIYPPWFLHNLPLPFSLLPSLPSLLLFVVSDASFANIFGLHPLFLPLMVSRTGRMSSTSSHFESHSVKILAHRSRALSRPSRDSRSMGVISPSEGRASGDSDIADALVAMRSYFDVDSSMMTRRLVEVRKNYFVSPKYKLHVPLPGERPYDTFLCSFNLSTDALDAGLRFSLHPMIEGCLEGWRVSPSQMAPNLCVLAIVDVGVPTAEKRPTRGDPRVRVHHPGALRGALHPTLAKQAYKCSFEELMNRADKSVVWVALEDEVKKTRAKLESLRNQQKELELEVGVLRSSLDGPRNDRAHLEGEVLSLTEAVAFFEAELKGEGPKVVAAYKASQGSSWASRRWGGLATSLSTEWLSNGFGGSISR